MKKIFETVSKNPLFDGIGYNDFEKILMCIEARAREYNKNDFILLSGESVESVGIIVSGGAKIIQEDLNGNVTILTELKASDLFAEVFTCAGIERSPVTVQASEKSVVLFINYRRIITSCTAACGFHARLIENMLKLIAKKNLMLNQKIAILSKRTTREKLLLFFDTQRGVAKRFTIPYNRDEMARYLSVDRSAMSNELCKMRDEGLIAFNKNQFEIL